MHTPRRSLRIDVSDTENFKDVDLMLFDKVIAFDNFRQKLILIANMKLSEGEAGYNKAKMELQQMSDLLRNGDKVKNRQESSRQMLQLFSARRSTAKWSKRQRAISTREISSR